MIYSHSRLCTFEQCPYKFKLRYIEKIDPVIKDSIESFLGRMVHLTLEKLYTDLQIGHLNSLQNLYDYLILCWDEQFDNDILIVKKQFSVDKYRSLAKRYIKNYFQSYKPFTQTKTISIEDHFIFSLDENNQYRIQGFVDRFSGRSDKYFIHDYKTSSRLPSKQQLDNDRQLGLYTLGIKQKYPDVKDISLVWHYLKFNKELHSSRTNKQLNTLSSHVMSLIDTIESSTSFPCNPSFLCHWCEYKPICPSFSPLYQVKEYMNNYNRRRKGQQFVDQYVNLDKSKKDAN